MFIQWLQSSKIAMWSLTVIRVYVGYKWLTAGWGKLTGGFDATGFMQGAIAKSTGEHPAVQDWWAVFLKHAARPASNGSTSSFHWANSSSDLASSSAHSLCSRR